MNEQIQVDGWNLVALVQNADRHSPLFGRRVRNSLREYGIDNPATGEQYPANVLVRLINEFKSDIGHRSVLSAGEYLGRTAPGMCDCETAVDSLRWLAKLPELTYQSPTERYPIGQYFFDRMDGTAARIGVSERFPYPVTLTKGAISGAIRAADESTGSIQVVRTRPKSDEKAAFYVDWDRE